jgi:hypothetical protein
VDLRRALTFTFADPRWPATLGLATVLNLPSVLLLAVALIGGRPTLAWMPGGALGADLLWSAATGLVSVPFSGYLLRIARGALSGQDAPLPGWSDVGGLLRDGLALGVLILLWFLPVDLAREAAGREPGASDDVLRLAFQALEGAFTLVVPVVLPAAEGRLAATGSLPAALDPRAAVATVRRNPGGYALIAVALVIGGAVAFGLGIGLVAAGSATAGGALGRRETVVVGLLAALAVLGSYGWFVLYHLTGQAYAGAHPDLGPVAPPDPRDHAPDMGHRVPAGATRRGAAPGAGSPAADAVPLAPRRRRRRRGTR